MIDIQVGDLVFSGRRGNNFYSQGVKWFTGSKWSHCFFIMTDVAGERAVLEADMHCQVVPWNREYVLQNDDYYEVYRPIKDTDVDKAAAADATYKECSGEIYGYTQIIWFVWDAMCKKLGLNSGRQWFPNGIVCSGVQDKYAQRLPISSKAFSQLTVVNRVTPQEMYVPVVTRPELFKLVGKRD
jgi:hypothetical protein